MIVKEDFFDAIVISDTHLGIDICQLDLLEEFLKWAVVHCRKLIINGDFFDDLNLKKLLKNHFNCLEFIRSHLPKSDFIWVRGNHDEPSEVLSNLLGVHALDQYVFDNGRIRILVIHGDQFDDMTLYHPYISDAACYLFYFIVKWTPHRFSRWIRRSTKRLQRNSEIIREKALAYAKSRHFKYITCGHTHLPLAEFGEICYINTGTWIESPPCPFLTIKGDEIHLEYWG